MTYSIKNIQKIVPRETIHHEIKEATFPSLVNTLGSYGFNTWAALLSLSLFRQCSPLYDAITRITCESKMIEPFIYKIDSDEYLDKHPVLDLLKKPNYEQTREEFIEQAEQYHKVTGNAYFIVTARNPLLPVAEIFNASPEFVSITGNSPDAPPETYQYSALSDNQVFKPEIIKGQLRYFNFNKTQELLHWKQLDIFKSRSFHYGMSSITPLWLEIEQYLKASNHNLSMLIRGVSSAGIFSTPDKLTMDQRTYLREQLDRFHAGANNAGRTIIVDGGMDFTQTTITNKDMDYERMLERITKRIYSTEKIPLPQVTSDTMTYNNMEVSKLELYDNAVLPLTHSLFSFLQRFLMPRYEKDPNNYLIEYEEGKIPALAVRRFETIKRQKELGIFSVNELRTELKYENAVGGSNIFASGAMSTIPIANVPDATEDLEPLADDFEEEVDVDVSDGEKDSRYLAFLYAGKNMKNSDGTPAFTNEEMKQLWQA
jgi:HK97 family phage portal protein